jgi:hypothetical protein
MEDNHAFDLRTAKMSIRSWQTSYFRKNSRKPATIQLRAWHEPAEQIFWKYYVELHVGGKVLYQTRITAEAYDTLNLDPELKRSYYAGVDFTILKTHQP